MELTLKVWKRGAPGGTVCSRLFPMGAHDKKEKVSKPQTSKHIPLEMGTGGGGGGSKKGGSGGKSLLKIKWN